MRRQRTPLSNNARRSLLFFVQGQGWVHDSLRLYLLSEASGRAVLQNPNFPFFFLC